MDKRDKRDEGGYQEEGCLMRIHLVIARSAATWRSRHPKDGPSSNEIAALRSQ